MGKEMLKIETWDEEAGTEIEIELPGKFEVCTRCEGRGKHVNPAVDGNGLSQEDFDQDPDFKEDYLAGRYDIECEECQGQRVVLVADEAKMTPEEKGIWAKHRREEAQARRERESELRWGF